MDENSLNIHVFECSFKKKKTGDEYFKIVLRYFL